MEDKQEMTEQKTETKEVSKPKVSKPKVSSNLAKGSVDSSYSFDKKESEYVHYVLTDFASERSKDPTKVYQPRTRIVKTHPKDFVSQFGCNFPEDHFPDVLTPSQIVRLSKNIEAEHIESAYFKEIQESTKGDPRLKRDVISRMLDSARRLNLSGSNQIIEPDGILHIPNVVGFEHNAKELGTFPKECMY